MMMMWNLDHDPSEGFLATYKCLSMAMLDMKTERRAEELEEGGKVIMPASALGTLQHLNIAYPMMFRMTRSAIATNADSVAARSIVQAVHFGVLEFVANEGQIHVPSWMMRNMGLDEEDLVDVENVALRLCTYAKFRPRTQAFISISNQKAVLEKALRNFACLTLNEIIAIKYNNQWYELEVMELKPDPAVSIIETDMEVDFEYLPEHLPKSLKKEPVGPALEPILVAPALESDEGTDSEEEEFKSSNKTVRKTFVGVGQRIDGKPIKRVSKESTPIKSPSSTSSLSALGVASSPEDKQAAANRLVFLAAAERRARAQALEAAKAQETSNQPAPFQPFAGTGRTLKK